MKKIDFTTFAFDIKGDYKAQLDLIVKKVEGTVKNYTTDERIQMTQELTDKYIEETGRVPDSLILERLGNVIDHDYISDTSPGKMGENSPYSNPYHTEGMYRTRTEREASYIWTEEVGSDGRDYRAPTRMNRQKLRDASS